MKSSFSYLKYVLVAISLSLLTTFFSYGVITGRNVKVGGRGDTITITGEHIIELPCASPNSSWRSDDPVLPETRGIPFNYHYWNPCEGSKILRTGFLLDVGFWFAVFGVGLLAFRILKAPKNPSIKS